MAITINKQQNSLRLLALVYSFILANLSICFKKNYLVKQNSNSSNKHKSKPTLKQEINFIATCETRLMQDEISTVTILWHYSNLAPIASAPIESKLNKVRLPKPPQQSVGLSFEDQLINTLLLHLTKPNLLLQEVFSRTAASQISRIIMVVSSIPISENNRQKLQQIMIAQMGVNVYLRFLSRADFWPGIQLWSLDYNILCNLERFVIELSN